MEKISYFAQTCDVCFDNFIIVRITFQKTELITPRHQAIIVLSRISKHYENLPIQYIKKFFQKQNIEYTLERLCRGGSNQYSQSMFWIKNKKREKKKIGIPLQK